MVEIETQGKWAWGNDFKEIELIVLHWLVSQRVT